MIKKTSELIESINRLNKKKPLKEAKDITAVLFPADYDAQKQHEEALKASAERRDPSKYSKEVQDFIKATASEESRYRHFDVVDRKDLARKINEAKSKGLPFKISRSIKEGYRYDFKILKEEYIKKDAGIPEVNSAMFNKATNVGSLSGSLGEDLDNEKSNLVNCEGLVMNILQWLGDNSSEDLDLKNELLNYLVDELNYDEDSLNSLFNEGDVSVLDSLICSEPECELDIEVPKLDDVSTKLIDVDSEHPLDEELKIYTSSLENFHPSERAQKLWDEIRDAEKIPDLEYALETLYEDGISDQALDDMLIHEEDWIRDLIGLEPNEHDEADDYNYPETDYSEDDDEEPLDYSDEDDDDSDLEVIDDTDEFIDEFGEEDVEPVYYDDEKPAPKTQPKELEDDSDKEVKKSDKDNKNDKDDLKEDLDQPKPIQNNIKKDLGPNSQDYEAEDLIDGFLSEKAKLGPKTDVSSVKEAPKQNTPSISTTNEVNPLKVLEDDEKPSEIPELDEAIQCGEDDDEIVAIDEDAINEMMGFQKKAADQEKEAKKE